MSFDHSCARLFHTRLSSSQTAEFDGAVQRVGLFYLEIANSRITHVLYYIRPITYVYYLRLIVAIKNYEALGNASETFRATT